MSLPFVSRQAFELALSRAIHAESRVAKLEDALREESARYERLALRVAELTEQSMKEPEYPSPPPSPESTLPPVITRAIERMAGEDRGLLRHLLKYAVSEMAIEGADPLTIADTIMAGAPRGG